MCWHKEKCEDGTHSPPNQESCGPIASLLVSIRAQRVNQKREFRRDYGLKAQLCSSQWQDDTVYMYSFQKALSACELLNKLRCSDTLVQPASFCLPGGFVHSLWFLYNNLALCMCFLLRIWLQEIVIFSLKFQITKCWYKTAFNIFTHQCKHKHRKGEWIRFTVPSLFVFNKYCS